MRFFFLLIISLTTTFCTSYAQFITKGDYMSPKDQCKALNKKRTIKNGGSTGRKASEEVYPIYSNYPVFSPESLAQQRAEAEEKRNMMQSEEPELLADANTQFKFQAFEPDGSPPVDLSTLPKPVNDRHAEVRKKVYDMIRAGKANQPITESLYFLTAMDEFAYADFEPFLMAVEFALQGKMVLVEGHTDSRGDDQYNLELSMKRVRQIERLMLEIGVPEERLSVIGYGETMPTHDNNTEDGMQKNRRVDFKIY